MITALLALCNVLYRRTIYRAVSLHTGNCLFSLQQNERETSLKKYTACTLFKLNCSYFFVIVTLLEI